MKSAKCFPIKYLQYSVFYKYKQNLNPPWNLKHFMKLVDLIRMNHTQVLMIRSLKSSSSFLSLQLYVVFNFSKHFILSLWLSSPSQQTDILSLRDNARIAFLSNAFLAVFLRLS